MKSSVRLKKRLKRLSMRREEKQDLFSRKTKLMRKKKPGKICVKKQLKS